MTPERKQCWDSLPRREKMLRKKIWDGVELGMIDEHCYDYWLGRQE